MSLKTLFQKGNEDNAVTIFPATRVLTYQDTTNAVWRWPVDIGFGQDGLQTIIELKEGLDLQIWKENICRA